MKKEESKIFQEDPLPPDETGDQAQSKDEKKVEENPIPDSLTQVKNASATGLGAMGRNDEPEE